VCSKANAKNKQKMGIAQVTKIGGLRITKSHVQHFSIQQKLPS